MPRTSQRKEVHRDLHLVSPLLRGPDVRELQEAINALLNHYKFNRGIKEDGDYGRRTKREAYFVAKCIGLDKARLSAIGHGRITEEVQHLIRNPEDRSKQDRAREEAREPWMRKVRKEQGEGMDAAVKWALAQVGANEEPPNSNHGPYPIDECQSYFGLSGVPWCGCFAGYAIEVKGGINTGTWWPYAGSIRQDAIAGRNGLHDINPANADIGCVATFFSGGDDHVALIRGKSNNGRVLTVEGNTSSATRDADGGIVEAKERTFGEVTCVARVDTNA